MEKHEGTRTAQLVGKKTGDVPGRVGHLCWGSGCAQALPGLVGTAQGARSAAATGEEVPGVAELGKAGEGGGNQIP